MASQLTCRHFIVYGKAGSFAEPLRASGWHSLQCSTLPAGALLADREAQVVELEERIAHSEAALNKAIADLEDKSAKLAALGDEAAEARGSSAAPEHSKSGEPVTQLDQLDDQLSAAAIQPQIPEITEVSADRGRKVLEDSQERFEELEGHVRLLEVGLPQPLCSLPLSFTVDCKTHKFFWYDFIMREVTRMGVLPLLHGCDSISLSWPCSH